jgi:flagellar motor protein MotB
VAGSLRLLTRRRSDTESLWLITFADLMVQLMAFFALLYSFGAADQAKVSATLKSLQKALGVQAQFDTSGQQQLGTSGLDEHRAADLEKLLTDLQMAEGRDVGVRMRIVSFRGSLLFEAGSTQLAPGSNVLLDRIAKLTEDYPGFTLICEGHAAPGERSGANDALSLSSLRAQSAMRELQKRGVSGERLALEAHGDTKPEGDATSPEGAALSRQVKFRFQRVAER